MKNDTLKGQYRINEQIRAKEVRIVGDDIEPKVYPIFQALKLAEEKELDLVEISPNAQPPVCRVIDYSKFLYQLKKRQKEQKAKQVKVNVKEIRFGPQTDDHDYNFKLKHAKGFLEDGDKVKAYVFFKGRSILFKEQGEVLLLRFANDLEDYAKVDQMPVLEGKRMTIQLSPKKKEAPKKPVVAKPAAPAQKAKQVKVNVKEIRFGPQTDDHDYNFKLKHAKGFLEDGDKVKAYVFFKGRSILFKEQGEVLLLRFANDLEDYAKVDQMPVLEGKRMTIQLSPKKKEAPKKPVVAKPAAPAQKAEMPKTDAE